MTAIADTAKQRRPSAPTTEMRKAARPTLTEAQLQQFGTELLALDGWRPLRTDPVRNREWGKGFGEPGMPDYLYMRYDTLPSQTRGLPLDVIERVTSGAQVLWIEWKRVRNDRRAANKAEQHQKQWHAAERARGALVLVAGEDFECTPEGFKSWYVASGLNRAIR